MHQIVCRLRLHPIPLWGSLQCSPDPLAALGGGAARGKGTRDGRGKRRGKERKAEEGDERGRDKRGGWTPQIFRWIDAFG